MSSDNAFAAGGSLYHELLLKILSCLDEREPPKLTYDDVVDWPDGAMAVFVDIGILAPSSYANTVLCQECGEPHDIRFIKSPNGERHALHECPNREGIGLIPISKERLATWSLNLPGFLQWVVHNLGRDGRLDEVVPNRLWLIGRPNLNGRSIKIYLARGAAWTDAPEIFSGRLSADAVVLSLCEFPRCVFGDGVRCASLSSILSADLPRKDRLPGEPPILMVANTNLAISILPNIAYGNFLKTADLTPSTEVFMFEDDFSTVWLHGRQFNLNETRAKVVRHLWNQHKLGRPFVPIRYLIHTLLKDMGYDRIKDVFAGLPDWKLLVVMADKTKGEPARTYRLGI